MTTRHNPWPAGTPCWVDIMVGDLKRSQRFYAEVLGWSFDDGDPAFGGYTNARVEGLVVAGMSPTMPGMQDAPHVWTVYLATNDVTATDHAALEAGAGVLAPPMTIGTMGSMAVWTDPSGAAFGAWQAGEHTGYQLANQPGAVTWCDVTTSDVHGARDFYARVFGYQYQDIGPQPGDYAMFTVPGEDLPAGGIGVTPADHPDSVPGWAVCFEVADADAAQARIVAAGGGVVRPAHDFDYGRLVAAHGPDREPFALMTSDPGQQM